MLGRAASIALAGGDDVRLRERAHARPDRVLEEAEPVGKQEPHRGPQHGDVSHRPPLRRQDPVAPRDLRTRNARNPVVAAMGEPRLAVDEKEAAGAQHRHRRGRRRRGRDRDEHVALPHLVAAPDRCVVPAEEGRDRGAAPLGLELGKALHPVAGAGKRVGEDLRREHHTLAAAAGEEHLLHASIVRPRRGARIGDFYRLTAAFHGSAAERVDERPAARRAVAGARVPGAPAGAICPVSALRDVVEDGTVEARTAAG